MTDQCLGLFACTDAKLLAQHGNIGIVFVRTASHQLAGQDILQINGQIEMQFAVGVKQPRLGEGPHIF